MKVDMSHQEVERLLEELEEVLKQDGFDWITAQACGMWLCHDLGYEDQSEFEDALHGTFEQFIIQFPHIETKTDEKGRMVLRLKPEVPQERWRPVKMTLKITDRSQLWNVCMKTQHARVEIPELEFEISADGKRKIDSIYNIVGSAIFNLGTHVRAAASGLPGGHKEKIMECVEDLGRLLDVDTPWTWVLHDPSGQSEFSDMKDVEVEWPEGPIPPAPPSLELGTVQEEEPEHEDDAPPAQQ
eukprot:CAMPEP_0119108350 /NCGR_PEP_ID=MMETSP1180-20130426/13904_1 /TAXON_ID=3052 ORGANISM="Chlamydomonas cf sp, Strain CCMP681" /NCGR_SAMPLE_ID=MMETSP1180 /ASSEMBLY_ACC=CAM_ASM_000741 /LENGTH=241 /DNA_ID=CAMNT_0007093953 /DNA_START=102 /DNA_END=827 /DNA_ORIENTATION=-